MFKNLAPGAIGIRGLSTAETIALAERTGFEGIDFDITQADAFRGTSIKPGAWGLPRDAAELPRLAAAAKALGCDRCTTGIMPGSNDMPYDEAWKYHVGRLMPICKVLADSGIRLGIEFIGPKTLRDTYKHQFVYSLDGMMELARAIGTGNVGVLLDAFHLYVSHGTNVQISALSAKDVVAVHVNDAVAGRPPDEQQDRERDLPLASGVIDLRGFMAALRKIGYDGPVTVEPFNEKLNEIAATDPTKAALITKESLERLFAL